MIVRLSASSSSGKKVYEKDFILQFARACTERPDSGEHNLRCSAYEALNRVISNAAEDTMGHMVQLLPVILQRLEASEALAMTARDEVRGTVRVAMSAVASVPFSLAAAAQPRIWRLVYAASQRRRVCSAVLPSPYTEVFEPHSPHLAWP